MQAPSEGQYGATERQRREKRRAATLRDADLLSVLRLDALVRSSPAQPWREDDGSNGNALRASYVDCSAVRAVEAVALV